MKFRLGELFSGPGGLGLGASLSCIDHNGEEFSIEHVWANDIDPDACETYRRNIIPDHPERVICKPVQELDITQLAPIDAFAYGFPCNDFSIVGEHNGMHGEYGGLFYNGVKVINHHNPLWFFAENVGGLQSANEGKAFEHIQYELSNAGIGYNITTHLYKFEEYGVPQNRHRIIMIGIRKDQNLIFKVPAPISPNLEQQKSVRTAIEQPPIPKDAYNNELTSHPKHIVDRLNHIPPGKNAWYEKLPQEYRLNVKGAKLSQIYRRLDPDLPSYTITGSGGGGTHVYHWAEPRALTNRERARIQTFPDSYIFHGGKESVRKQIGMAVPPAGARIIIEAVLKTFARVDYPSVPAKWNIIENNGAPHQLNMEFHYDK